MSVSVSNAEGNQIYEGQGIYQSDQVYERARERDIAKETKNTAQEESKHACARERERGRENSREEKDAGQQIGKRASQGDNGTHGDISMQGRKNARIKESECDEKEKGGEVLVINIPKAKKMTDAEQNTD